MCAGPPARVRPRPGASAVLAAWAGNANHLGDCFGWNAEFAIAAETAAEGDFGLAEEAALRAFALLGHGAVRNHFPMRLECGARLEVDLAHRCQRRTGHGGDRRHERLQLP